MKKLEIFIALILGAVLGIGGMLLVVIITKAAIKKVPTQTSNPTATVTPTINAFQITSPTNNSAWGSAKVDLTGKTVGNIPIIIASEKEDLWVTPTKDNTFSASFSPIQGINKFTVYELNNDLKHEVNIFSVPGITNGSTYENGTITDITKETIQVKLINGEIQQISNLPDIKAINITKTIKEIPYSEVAIGDIIFPIGTLNQNNFQAKYVVVYNSPNIPVTREIVNGVLDSFDKTGITLKQNSDSVVVPVPSSAKLVGVNADGSTRTRTKFIDSDKGSTIYAVLTGVDDKKLTRTVFIKAPDTSK